MCFKWFKNRKKNKNQEVSEQNETLKDVQFEEQKHTLKEVQVEEVEQDDDIEEDKDEKEVLEKESVVRNVYHISKNKKEDSLHFKEWRVRKEGSSKTIKYFPTQKEAIEYARQLAENNDGSIIIHGMDGKIRKAGWGE